jgi:hypothetical protein
MNSETDTWLKMGTPSMKRNRTIRDRTRIEMNAVPRKNRRIRDSFFCREMGISAPYRALLDDRGGHRLQAREAACPFSSAGQRR